jgi:carbonic anhydrase
MSGSIPPRVAAGRSLALAALERLREGNRRFASNVRSVDSFLSQTRRAELAEAQNPSAIVLGCSDSRVPAEIVFDQGLGDLFVIRVAGNIVAPSQIGSVEFAAERFGTRLVVVLGHTRCSAVDSAVRAAVDPSAARNRNLLSIVDRVRPVVDSLLGSSFTGDTEGLTRRAVRANVRASAAQLRQGSRILEQLILEEGLVVVGAEYDLATGEVDFFDGVPRA